jgi:hypothetical protein
MGSLKRLDNTIIPKDDGPARAYFIGAWDRNRTGMALSAEGF